MKLVFFSHTGGFLIPHHLGYSFHSELIISLNLTKYLMCWGLFFNLYNNCFVCKKGLDTIIASAIIKEVEFLGFTISTHVVPKAVIEM
jgi:hypothetical protein